MFHRLLVSLAVWLTCLPALAIAQGLLVDVRPDVRFRLPRPIPAPRPEIETSYKIKEIGVDVNLRDQVAQVQVSQSFVNTGSRQMEVSFIFPLPYDGAIDQLTFLVDGKEYEAQLMTAAEARRIYEGYIRRNQDPALLEWLGVGMFKTSVFPVPPGAERKVTLRYSQLCRKYQGLTEFIFPMSTAKYTSQAVEDVRVNVNVQSQANIKNVFSPTHALEIKRPSDKHAVATFSSKNQVPSNDFRLLYDVGDAAVGASVVSYRPDSSEDGFFLLLMSPEIKREGVEIARKSVVIVVDRSGSMSGAKMEQARQATKFVLNNLREGDTFNIVAYDSTVQSFKPELQRFNDDTRKEALGFVEGIYAGGSTNISGALTTALGQLVDDNRPSYVLFLTDGLPTHGETNEAKIAQLAREHNKVRARVFSFGVGFDVNSRLLDRLSREGFGQSEYVRPDEDIEASVSRLYNRIGAPAMTNVAISVDVEGHSPERGPSVHRIYPRDAYDLFAGDQLVLVGRYKSAGAAKVTVRGQVEGKELKLDFPAQLVDKSTDQSAAFVEKIWALRRVGEIIDEIDLSGKNQELIDELVKLATKHGILTPYTSFLADDQPGARDLADARRRAGESLDRLRETAGRDAFAQRALKGDLQRAAQAPAGFGGGGLAGPATADRQLFANGDGAAFEKAQQTVLHQGNKTFYRRGAQWVDSTVTPEQEQRVRKIERYSDAYFELARRLGRDAAQHLALEGEVIVVLDGQAYQF